VVNGIDVRSWHRDVLDAEIVEVMCPDVEIVEAICLDAVILRYLDVGTLNGVGCVANLLVCLLETARRWVGDGLDSVDQWDVEPLQKRTSTLSVGAVCLCLAIVRSSCRARQAAE
jgi:hypothetical protein